MKKLILTMIIACGLISAQAQNSGDWYVGTGDIANTAWTEWAVSPTVGYGITDNLMVGLNVSQADSTVDMTYDLHARYYLANYFIFVKTTGFNTDAMSVGVGKMFTIHKGIYVDPKVVYNAEEKTTNLTLGFGLKF